MLALATNREIKWPSYPYRNFVAFEKEFFQSKEYKQMGKYWSKQLERFDFYLSVRPSGYTGPETYHAVESFLSEEASIKLFALRTQI